MTAGRTSSQHLKKSQSDNTRTQRLRKLLVARSHLPITTTPSQPPIPPRPEQGHASFRLTAGLGYEGEQYYQSLRLRPAYHDLMDPEAGYAPGAQINFLELSLRHRTDNTGLKLETMKILDIVSLTPRDRFFQQLSWKINTGWQRRPLDENKRALVYHSNGGIGLSYKPMTNVLGYAFLEGNLDLGGALWDNYALGIGGNTGVFVDIGTHWRGLMYASVQRFELGHTQTLREIGLEQRLTLSPNSALRLQMKHHDFADHQANSQIELNLQWYF